jgi:hypothetical protein
MNRPLVLIVGLQKSGTTLLVRLLQDAGVGRNVFAYEGDDFWGNVPPFSPAGCPAGVAYQRSGGDDGHEIGTADATSEVRSVLETRLARLDVSADVIVNKNPYNTVRLRWLRALFPAACIVSMVRDPVANVFSLLKKYVPHEGRGLAPQEGWWGVKPRGWRQIRSDDKVLQCAAQWNAVAARLLSDADCVDLIVPYRQLCERPRDYIEAIRARVAPARCGGPREYPSLDCFDGEFARGSRLLSKNRTATFAVPPSAALEFPPFDTAQIGVVRATCEATYRVLERFA